MNTKRKNRGGSVRSQRVKSVQAEGVYNNAHFMHAATLQVGNPVRIRTASGVIWEGVFKTFSCNFDVVLEVAARVEYADGVTPTLVADSLVEKLIFKAGDISTIVAADVDLEFPTRDTFQTDTAISSRLNNGNFRPEEKELEPWEASSNGGGGLGDGLRLELDNTNGWDANEMFRKNEQEYGVTSTFDHSLKGYTVPLDAMDTPDYKEAEAKAEKIAMEIENQPQHKARAELENGDEESMYAAVHRPPQEPTDKYIPPAKRKNQNSGKLVRSTPPPQQPSPQQQPQQVGPSNPQTNKPGNNNNLGYGGHQMHSNAPPHLQQQPINIQHHQVAHGRHTHTPPHGYAPMQRQVAPSSGGKPQINGETSKQMSGGGNRPPRGYAQAPPPHQQHQQQQQQVAPPTQYQDKVAPPTDGMTHARHDVIKDLHVFAQDFKLATNQPPPPPPPANPSPVTNQMEVVVVASTVPPPTQLHGGQVVGGVMEQQQQQQQQQQVAPPMQQQQQAQVVMKVAQQVAPQSQPTQPPQQSASPHQDASSVDKIASNLKNSTLNPLAKEFVFNPTAKPFQPSSCQMVYYRSPSTPSASRPHTPQTPSHSPYNPVSGGAPGGQPPMSMVMPLSYVMTQQHQYQPQPQGNRMRKSFAVNMGQMRTDVTSQMQVAAATGQPLLAPAPLQPFVYSQSINHQGYPSVHGLRMDYTPPQLQYLPPGHSQAPSPAQPPQYNPGGGGQGGPQPSPQQYQPAQPPPQGHHQFPIICQMLPAQPHMMQSLPAYLHQQPPPPPPQTHMSVMLPHHQQQQQQHPQQQQQHGQAP